MREKSWAVQRLLQICCICLLSVLCVTVTCDYTLNTCYAHCIYFVHIPWVFIKSWNYHYDCKMRFSLPLVSCYTGRISTQTRATSRFCQPRRRPVFLAEGSTLLNCPLKFLRLFRTFCACVQQEADPPWSRAWLFITWTSYILRSPFINSPAATFQSLQKKRKLLDLCFPGVSVPHLTYQSLFRQEAAKIL